MELIKNPDPNPEIGMKLHKKFMTNEVYFTGFFGNT